MSGRLSRTSPSASNGFGRARRRLFRVASCRPHRPCVSPPVSCVTLRSAIPGSQITVRSLVAFLPVCLATSLAMAVDTGAELQQAAAHALRRGVEYFRNEVCVQGGYLWQYSEDLTRREGEGKAPRMRVWVQPPGTPSVGMALLAAYEATGEAGYRDAVKETADALVRGQLRSGGWAYYIDFDDSGRRKLAYRDGGGEDVRNVTVLDDNTTQAALRYLMRADRTFGFKDAKLHECVRYGLESLLKAQYPNGAWPQAYDRFPEADKFPVKPASIPEQWPSTCPGGDYWHFYTLNDNVLADLIETCFDAAAIYTQAPDRTEADLATRCRAAAERAGGFLLMAQLPEPQPAWAQQYNFEMHPTWARKFEPPAITGSESQRILRTLLMLYRQTGDARYLEPIPRAVAYLRRSRLPDGGMARFYELNSNRPLFFTRDYKLTYDGGDVPTHYAFRVGDYTEGIVREYERLKVLPPAERRREAGQADAEAAGPDLAPASARGRRARPSAEEIRRIIAAQDGRGRWVEAGRLRYHGEKDETRRVIRCETFIRNVTALSAYLEPGEGGKSRGAGD